MTDEDWDQRILCSDGNCIGIIGSDGNCRTCGKPYSGDAPLPVMANGGSDDQTAVMATESSPEKAAPMETAEDRETSAGSNAGDSWENRTLCIDESCIGVVGPDGRCNECGKPYPG